MALSARRSTLVLLLATVCAVQSARADAVAAEALVKEAEALAAANDFVGAAAKFREAYNADKRIELMCNVGVAYHKAKDLPRAQLFLSHCLKRGTALQGDFVAAVRGVLATVEGALKQGDFTPVDIVVDPEGTSVAISTLVTDAAFVGAHLVWLPFGKHDLTFRADGHIEQTITIETTNRETTPISVKLEKKPMPAPIMIKPRIERKRRSLIPAISASAVTIGAIVFTIVAYDNAHDRSDIVAFATSPEVIGQDADYIEKWNTRMAIAGGVSVIGALASGFFWYRALEPTTKVEVTPTTSGAQVTFRTRF